MLLIINKKSVIGAKVFLYSSIIFIPLGIIGMIGARKIIDADIEEKFLNKK
ncbi:MAG: hypothetical protein IPO21_05695 [Bacteroidales bacterium]|nr:hypothetical protein [Bacteroidales bacterium]